ncbi:MAG: hypothetical protein ACRDYY_07900 [Acidimicrobiales bacterium]
MFAFVEFVAVRDLAEVDRVAQYPQHSLVAPEPVVESHLQGNDDPEEWTGTEITFEISRQEGKTERPSSAWGFYINASLKRLITTGEGPATPPWA